MVRHRSLLSVLLMVAALVVVAAFPLGASGAKGRNGDRDRDRDRDGRPPGQPQAVLVALADGGADPAVVAADLQGDLGVTVTEVYPEIGALAAEGPAADLARLRRDRRVGTVEPQRRVVAHGELTRGADRIGADRETNGGLPTEAGKPVAVLDTGIARSSDLNVVGGRNCVGRDRAAWEDRHGHGTHVAGTIGALANGDGVAGVAPGTPLWAVKVLGDDGTGSTRSLVCGLEWVLANAKPHKIAVANLSLGVKVPKESRSNCRSSATHNAICKLKRAGVAVVVSAGNDGADAADYVPAKFDQVTTVAALADSDGCAGGQGRATPYGPDDGLASFSNGGAVIDVAAPGVNVVSTAPNGGTRALSGTSMAAPHVAAAVALGWTPGRADATPLANGDGPPIAVLALSDNTGCRGLGIGL